MTRRIHLSDKEIEYILFVVKDQLESIGDDPHYIFAREALENLRKKLEGENAGH